MFESILLVATRAGIGPMLSYLSSITNKVLQCKTVKVLWCAHYLGALHWKFAQDIIRRVDQMPNIIDSRHGRPGMVCEARRIVHGWAPEAVNGDGVAAYGATFDF